MKMEHNKIPVLSVSTLCSWRPPMSTHNHQLCIKNWGAFFMQGFTTGGWIIKAIFNLLTPIFQSLFQQEENVFCRGNAEELG